MTIYTLTDLPERTLSAKIELAEAVSHIAHVIPKSVVVERMKEGAKDPSNFMPDELFRWDNTDERSPDRANAESKEIYHSIIAAMFSREGKASKSQLVCKNSDKYGDISKFLIGADPQSPVDEETSRNLLGEMYLVDWLCAGELQARAECGGEDVAVESHVLEEAFRNNIDFINTGEIPSSGDKQSYRFMRVRYGDLNVLLNRVKRTGRSERKSIGAPSADYDMYRGIMDELVKKDPALIEGSMRATARLMKTEYSRLHGPKPLKNARDIVQLMRDEFDRYWGTSSSSSNDE